jgi:hypothetical protein
VKPEPSTQYTPQGWANWGSYSPHYGNSSDRLTARHSFAWNTQEDTDLLAGVTEGASIGQLALYAGNITTINHSEHQSFEQD